MKIDKFRNAVKSVFKVEYLFFQGEVALLSDN